MRLLRSISVLISLCAVSRALHEADVGVVDWHKQLIGVPSAGFISTLPSFHHVESRSLIFTITHSNVLAALEPEDGSIVWRHVFDPEDRIMGYYKNGSVIASLSGAGGATLRTFSAISGEILLEKKLHPSAGPLVDVHVGNHVIFSHSSADIYVLTNGHTVSVLNGETGELKWRWTSPDHGSLIIHNKLVLVDSKLYVIGFAKSTASYTFHVTILNSSTADVLRSSNIPANVLDPWTESAVITHSSFNHPVAAWIEKGILRYVPLVSNLKGKPKSASGSGYAQIKDVGVNGQVVVVRQNDSGLVMGFEGEQTTTKILLEFEVTNSDSIYISCLDGEGRSYIGRTFWSHSTQRGTTDIFAGHILQGKSTGSIFPYNIKQHGHIKNVALDPYNLDGTTVKPRLLLVSSTGSVQLWDGDNLKWAREEGLSNIATAQFVEIPERVGGEGILDHDSEAFLTRLLRQISSARDFPRYAINFATRFATGSYALPPTVVISNITSTEGLYRDPFGFRQIIVAATRSGKIYGIDSRDGKIIWSHLLGLGWAEEVGGQILPLKLHLTKTVSDGGDPEVVLVVQRRADNGLTDTVVFHVDAMTGRDVVGQSTDDDILQGQDIISGPLVENFFLNNEAKMTILLDEFLQVHLYPDTPSTQVAFKNVAHNLSFALPSKSGTTNRIIGHQISLSEDNFKAVAYPTWSLTFAPGEDTQAIIPPTTRGPIASVGRVLGNRTTLYKYLNPRLFSVLTATPSKGKCGLYVLDSMKGTIVYRTEVNANARGCEIKTALIDNWLVYHYYDDSADSSTGAGTKGYRIVSVEFYEGQGIDEKTRSIELSAFSEENINFHSYEQTYILPSGVTALTSTTTRFGISNKDIIIATRDGKVHFIPRSYLNPRRPHRKPTAEEVEEMLVPYDPVIPNDPKRVLSHNCKITNVQNIITSPALLESTSLIFAYGLDMFSTRMAPSGTFDVLNENFNKVQLVLTVFGLFVAILITRPMVRRKQLRERWYQ